MGGHFYYLHHKFPTLGTQLAILFFITINSILMPFIIYGSFKKKIQIMDPKINSSYSSISLLILNGLIIFAIITLISNIVEITLTVFC